MSWPPTDAERCEILQSSPPGADPNAVWAMVESAVREFVDNEERDKAQHLLLRQMAETCANILNLQPPPKIPLDPDTETILQAFSTATQEHVATFVQIGTAAQIRSNSYLLRDRQKRFFSRLSLAWTGPGKGR
jgi:hypothetical protein